MRKHLQQILRLPNLCRLHLRLKLNIKMRKIYFSLDSAITLHSLKPSYILPFYYTKSPDYAVYKGNIPNNQTLNTELKHN